MKTNEISFSRNSILFFCLVLLFIILNICSLILISRNPIEGIYEIFKLILYLNVSILLFVELELNGSRFIEKLSKSTTLFHFIAALSIVVSIYNQSFTFNLFENKLYGGLFINPNLNSQILLLSVPLVLIGLSKKSKSAFRIQIIGIILCCICLIVLYSKTIILSALLSATIVLGVYFSKKIKRKTVKASITLILIVLISLLAYNFSEKITNLHSIKHRTELWSRTIQLIEDKPLWGAGLTEWSVQNLNYVPTEEIKKGKHTNIEGIYTPSGAIFYKRPHNDFLWVFSELGILGCLNYVSIFAFLFYSFSTAIKNKEGKERIKLAILGTITLSYFIISQFSFPKERIEQSLILFISSAILLFLAKGKKQIQFKIKFLYVFILVAIVSIGFGTIRATSDYNMKLVKEDRFNQRWSSLIYHLNKINTGLYPFASDGQPVELYRAIAELNLGKNESAYKALLTAKALNPNQLFVLSNLGSYYFKKQNTDSALYYYDKALELNPNFEDAILNKVAIYYNQGMFELAWEEIHKIPFTSVNNTRRDFLNLLLEERYKDSLLENANKKYNPEKVKRYFQTYQFRMFYLYSSSIKNKTTLENELDIALKKFK